MHTSHWSNLPFPHSADQFVKVQALLGEINSAEVQIGWPELKLQNLFGHFGILAQ